MEARVFKRIASEEEGGWIRPAGKFADVRQVGRRWVGFTRVNELSLLLPASFCAMTDEARKG
jgi:hypothetical protein